MKTFSEISYLKKKRKKKAGRQKRGFAQLPCFSVQRSFSLLVLSLFFPTKKENRRAGRRRRRHQHPSTKQSAPSGIQSPCLSLKIQRSVFISTASSNFRSLLCFIVSFSLVGLFDALVIFPSGNYLPFSVSIVSLRLKIDFFFPFSVEIGLCLFAIGLMNYQSQISPVVIPKL